VGTKYNILHIDDNPVFLELIKNIFNKDENFIYVPVLNTKNAFREIEKKMPDLLIADLMLKNDWDANSGKTFIKEVKYKYPDLAIMVLSARDEPKLRNKLKKYIILYQQKSFRPSEFLPTITNLLEKIQKSEEKNFG
jgi:DNA-binding NarL/FixJ family response regulator